MRKIILIIISSIIIFTSCNINSPDSADSIIGTWKWAETANNGNVYRFNSDGTYTIHSDTAGTEVLIENGTYTFNNNTITYNLLSFDDSGTYRDITFGDHCKTEISNIYFKDNIFSQRVMDGNSNTFIGTWNSIGFTKYYKLGSNGIYLYLNYSQSNRIFTDTTYTRTYNEFYEYDEDGNIISNAKSDFIYTDVSYNDPENWSGRDAGGTYWNIRSKLIIDTNKNYHLFEFMNRVE